MKPFELFTLLEPLPTVFMKTKQVSLNYVLTLILQREEADMLFLTSPGFRYLPPVESGEIKTVIQIEFSDLLIDLFYTKEFGIIGKFLRQFPYILQFSQNTVRQVKDEIVRMKMDNSFDVALRLLMVMKLLATEEDVTAGTDGFSPKAEPAAIRLNKVENYVKENYPNRITRDEAAQIAGLTTNAFSNFFTLHKGMTFMHYVNMIRINQAGLLLLKTEDTIAEIAYSCGFASPNYFNEVFKRYKGVTPGELRTKS
jgi:AraC-like DNA-binding protein